MKYYLIEFTSGLSGQAYQEISEGSLIRICDANGVTLELPENCEYYVVNEDLLDNLPNA